MWVNKDISVGSAVLLYVVRLLPHSMDGPGLDARFAGSTPASSHSL